MQGPDDIKKSFSGGSEWLPLIFKLVEWIIATIDKVKEKREEKKEKKKKHGGFGIGGEEPSQTNDADDDEFAKQNDELKKKLKDLQDAAKKLEEK